jgi:hypothetical protein
MASSYEASGGRRLSGSNITRRIRSTQQNRPKFVSAFCQSNCGDVSPNVLGTFCIDTGLPCDFNHSACNGKNELCYGRGPDNPLLLHQKKTNDRVSLNFSTSPNDHQGSLGSPLQIFSRGGQFKLHRAQPQAWSSWAMPSRLRDESSKTIGTIEVVDGGGEVLLLWMTHSNEGSNSLSNQLKSGLELRRELWSSRSAVCSVIQVFGVRNWVMDELGAIYSQHSNYSRWCKDS